MSEEYGEPPLAENKTFLEAVNQYDQCQVALFFSIGNLAANPYDKKAAETFSNNSIKDHNAFVDVVTVIASDDELSIDERANSIATWYFISEHKRLDFMRELSPTVEYEEGETESDEIIENIIDLFEADFDAESIGHQVGNNYKLSLMIDVDSLLEVAFMLHKPTNKDKAKSMRIHALEVGKMAAGVAIGTLIAQKVLKRTRD
jgi:hypothetical protein